MGQNQKLNITSKEKVHQKKKQKVETKFINRNSQFSSRRSVDVPTKAKRIWIYFKRMIGFKII